jgi:hypothetical protein
MTERLIEKFDRLAAEAGIKDVTPEIRRFAVLVRQDLVGWPVHEGVDLMAAEPDMRDKREANKENTMTEEELEATMLDNFTNTPPAQRTWVDLTDAEILECTEFKRFAYDPPYIEKDGIKRIGSWEVSLRRTYENINNKLKEKNT